MLDLYFARVLTTEQIAGRFWPEAGSVYFPASDPALTERGGPRHPMPRVPSARAALRRLQILRVHRHLVSRAHPRGGTILWMLAKGAFRCEAEDLRRYGETYPGWPKGRVEHLLDTNDLYVRVAGELDAILGPYPAWEWRDERRVHDEYRVGGRTGKHQPDAEVRLPSGHVFFVERQTKRARETAGAIREKVARHATRADYLGERGKACILFACDTERDVGYALDAAQDGGLPVFAGGVDEAASYLADEALRLS